MFDEDVGGNSSVNQREQSAVAVEMQTPCPHVTSSPGELAATGDSRYVEARAVNMRAFNTNPQEEAVGMMWRRKVLRGVSLALGILAIAWLTFPSVIVAQEVPECTIRVQLGESIQEAIDQAPEGTVIC